MASQFPERPTAHKLEAESIAYLQAKVPHGWTCEKPTQDYGVDLRIGIARADQITGEQFVVQVKAANHAPAGEYVSVELRVPTLNYLRNILDVALLVKYVAKEQEAYWLLLKDYTNQPREGQRSVTVRIPRANRLSAQPWEEISEHVRAVHYKKLKANVPSNPRDPVARQGCD